LAAQESAHDLLERAIEVIDLRLAPQRIRLRLDDRVLGDADA